ncbi:DUF4062 domain-containing protein [Mesorhizobium sp. CO1-1-8]|uniref:DUF4062 domain-containing protein n=1 Tax=Mesorhizobium sp. CO1-1-8 TaxID=2876631 RepID=UPI001CD14475|nr:DUF4062 domain-containing protein [Mesorhizobium sp. CO1-1-8]MBZ9776520.1 DUF4062 domain-containing protein [Mesorhizobium sp. CO1-1-8]
MTRQQQVVSVFVASPGDVADERQRLEEVINELNIAWSRQFNTRFELLRWETHTYPDVGMDGQDVINRHIPSDYDIFIGIMWGRFGTPTNRAESGTAEEFQRAKARYEENSDSVKIMAYFKDEPIPPSKMDPDQLTKINSFKNSLKDDGVLYFEFKDIRDFERLVRLHLSHQILNFVPTNVANNSIEVSEKALEPPASDAGDELGLFDYLEAFEKKFAEVAEIANRISDATAELGAKLQSRTSEVGDLKKNTLGQIDRVSATQIISHAADDLKHFSGRLDEEVPLYSEAFSLGMDAFIKYAALSEEFKNDDRDIDQVKENLDSIKNLRSILSSSKGNLETFRVSIGALPRMTSELNKARRRTADSMDRLLEEFSRQESMLDGAVAILEQMISNEPQTSLLAR